MTVSRSCIGERGAIRRGSLRGLVVLLCVALLAPASWMSTRRTALAAPSAQQVRTIPDPFVSGHAALYGWGATTMLDGSVLISDYRNYRIAHFAKNGTDLGTFAENPGSAPYGMAVDPRNGNVYLADTDRGLIKRFDPTGKFLMKWGGLGSGVGKFLYPSRIAVASDGRVYVADSWEDEIVVHDTAGKELFTFGGTGSANGQLDEPHGMAFDGQDRLFVVDAMNFRVQVFSKSGAFLYKFGSKGTGPGQFMGDVRGLAIDRVNGWVYVVDAGANRIHKFTLAGALLDTFGTTGSGPGQFIDGGREATVDGDGNLWVGDMPNFRAQKFSPQGDYLLEVPTVPTPPPDGGFNGPRGVAVDSSGNIFVTDMYNQRTQKFGPDGSFLTNWGSRGQGDYSFNYPRLLATDPRDGSVVVADTDNHLIKKFTNDGVFVWQSGGTGAENGRFRNPQGVDVGPDGRIYVADSNNARVQILGQNGAHLTTFGSKGTAPGQFTFPRGIAVDPDGTIWVSDTSDFISHFDATGNYLGRIGGPGTADDQLSNPFDVESDGTYIYVADTAADKIKVWKKDGTFVMAFGGSASMGGPVGLDLGPEGSLYIVEQEKELISEWLVSFGPAPQGPSSEATSVPVTNETSFPVAYDAVPGDSPITAVELWAKQPGDASFNLAATDPTPETPSFNFNAVGEGSYRFLTRAKDALGNYEPPPPVADSTTVVDTTEPAAPVIDPLQPSPGNTRTPAWGFVGETGASFECSLERATTTLEPFSSCVSPVSYDLTGRTDGVFKVLVRQTDEAGNLGPQGTKFYRLDTALPTSQATASSESSTRNLTIGYSTADTGVGVGEVELWAQGPGDSGFALVETDQEVDTPTFSFAAPTDGTFAFYTRAIDKAGNREDPPSTPDVVVLVTTTTPDTVAITKTPADPGNEPMPEWGFTGQTGLTFRCRLTRGSTVIRAWASCVSPRSYDLGSMIDDTYTFWVREVDSSGNVGPAVTDDYLIDRVLPASNVQSATLNSSSSIDITYASSDGSSGVSSVELWVHTPGVSGHSLADTDVTPGSPSFTYTPSGSGTYTFYTRGRDVAGNYETAPGSPDASVLVPTAAPQEPQITSVPTDPGNNSTPEWEFVGQAGMTFKCRLTRGGTVVKGWGACASPKRYDVSALIDGTYTFWVREVDASNAFGPASTDNYLLDRQVPTSIAQTAELTGPSTITIGYTAGDTSSGLDAVELWVRSPGATVYSLADTDATPGTPSFAYAASGDGVYSFYTRGRDSAGNYEGAPATPDVSLVTDAAPPESAASSPALIDGSPIPVSYSMSDSGSGVSEVELWTKGPNDADFTKTASATSFIGPMQFDYAASQGDGTYSFYTRARDGAGNYEDAPGAPDTVTVLDTTAPTAPALSPVPPSPTNDSTPTWSFAGESGGTFECSLSIGIDIVHGFEVCSSPHTYDLTGAADATFTFSVRQIDEAGNTGPAATDDLVIDRSIPTSLATAPSLTRSTPIKVTYGMTDIGSGVSEVELWARGPSDAGFVKVATTTNFIGPLSFDFTPNQGDGNYSFYTRARDMAGNYEAAPVSADAVTTLDRTAPAAPTLSSVPPSPATDSTPTWAFAGESGGSFECQLMRATTVIAGYASCTSPKTYDLAAQSDGNYTFFVRQIDAAGNVGPAATDDYLIDRGAPSSFASSPGTTRSSTFTVTYGSSDSGSGVTQVELWVRRPGDSTFALASTDSSPISPSFTYTAPGNGFYEFYTRARDVAGNYEAAPSSADSTTRVK